MRNHKYLIDHCIQEMEELLGEPLRPGKSLRRVSSFRSLGVRWAAGLTHRPARLGGAHTEACLDQLFDAAGRTERRRARGLFIQKTPGGEAGAAQTKETAWASKIDFCFPRGKTSLERLQLREESGELTVPPRRRLRGRAAAEAMQHRREQRARARGGVLPAPGNGPDGDGAGQAENARGNNDRVSPPAGAAPEPSATAFSL